MNNIPMRLLLSHIRCVLNPHLRFFFILSKITVTLSNDRHDDPQCWFRASQSLFVPLLAVCIGRWEQISMLWLFVLHYLVYPIHIMHLFLTVQWKYKCMHIQSDKKIKNMQTCANMNEGCKNSDIILLSVVK
jgi:hypothetical protein